MNLREFTSNDEEFNKRIKEEDRSRETHPSTLGVTWNTEEDKFIIKYRTLEIPKVTKRTVLRTIASIYDPMGYLIPLTLQQKIFFQKLWTKNYAWDTKLSQEDTENWQRIRAKAKEFEKSIPRRIAEKAAVHQLVVCTDASNEAMCAVVYLRNEESQNILIAKSRLPALKTKYTIPKLELSALTMGARLSINTMTELEGQIKIDRIFILSDSEIALSWVKNWTTHSEKGVLVKNRCKEIAEISGNLAKKGIPINFGYINTKFNPADVGTRGIAGSEFLNSIWWKGPQITALPEDTLLFQLERPPAPDEENAVNVANAVEMIGGTDGARFNSMSKLRRITAWVLRFVKGITKSLPQSRKEMMETRIPELLEANQEGPLTGREIKNATHAIEENLEESPSIRPIDFVQRDIIVTHPIARGKNQPNDDEDYLPPEEKAHLRTKRQAQEALRKSYEHTQKFWEVWSKSYLTELRELHKRRMECRRTTPAIPKVGQIVLIMDQTQPRNTWKMGKIERVAKFKDNIPREAEIKLATGRIQKRPINLLIPLELNTDTPEDEEEKGQETSESKEKTHRYNLRPKRAVKNASEEEEEDVAQEYTKLRENTQILIAASGPEAETQELPDDSAEAIKYLKGKITTTKQRIHRLTMMKKNIQGAIERMVELESHLDEEEKEVEEEINKEIEEATNVIINIEETLGQLSDKKIELQEELEDRKALKREIKEEEEESDPQERRQVQQSAQVQLPPIRVPTFSGKSWDWENFWQLFKYNIHNQPVSEVIKFNFLLEALPVQIKETIGRFQITREGYNEAIGWLKRHYERDDVIIEQLYTKLERIQNTGKTTAEQRRLFNQIATTVAQLRIKGENVDHRQLLTQITRKFEESIQDRIITRKAELMQTNTWNWDSLRDTVEDTLSRRELIEEMRELTRGEGRSREAPVQGTGRTTPRGMEPPCVYCKGTNHPAAECRV
ncbi:hypothetical protein GCK32_019892, partial [Trichostrongylus colubriformis]